MRERTSGLEEEVKLNRTIEELRTVVRASKEERYEAQTARDELRRTMRTLEDERDKTGTERDAALTKVIERRWVGMS